MPIDPRNRSPIVARFGRGIDTRSRETAIPDGALADASNVDITRDGHVVFAAGGYSAVDGAAGGHSLWSWPSLGYALYVSSAGNLTRVDSDGTTTALASVSADRPLAYAEHNGRAYYANGLDMGYIDQSGAAKLWGVDAPPAPRVSVGSDGGMPAGRYHVAITVLYNNGEESAPSLPQTVTLSDVGGITATLPSSPDITAVLVYISSTKSPDGTELYYHGRGDPGQSYLITGSGSGYRLNHLFKSRMPCCTVLAPFKRRILGAIGSNLYFSETNQVSICDLRHNWLPFSEPITCIAPVEDGCYIGTNTKTYWCAGNDPTEWSRIVKRPYGIASQPSVFYLPDDTFQAEGLPPSVGAPWFSQDGGVCIGRNGGFIQNITQGAVGIGPHREAALGYREHDGIRQLIAALRDTSPNTRSSPNPSVTGTSQYGITTT